MPGHARFTRLLQPSTVAQSEPETLLPLLFFVHPILRWWMFAPEASGAKALRVAARTKPSSQPLGRFMKSQGGINDTLRCSDRAR